MSNDYEYIVTVSKTYKATGFGEVDDIKKWVRDFDPSDEYDPCQLVSVDKKLVSYRLFEDMDYELWVDIHNGDDKS